MAEPDTEGAITRCGFIALLGAPNAGKSTLMNRLIGAKVSIVTPKVQTTRTRVIGIMIHGTAQLVFVDTPGIFEARRRLERAMVSAAWAGASEADVALVLVDAEKGLDGDCRRILDGLAAAARKKGVAAINKIDAVKHEKLLGIAAELDKTGLFSDIFMISALTGDGVDDMVPRLAALLPEGPWLYPEDQLSDMNDRLFAAEITREKLFLNLHQEVPYSLTVETEGWKERDDGSVRIDQTIYVEKPGQRAIVLGKGGQAIKRIGAAAREELGTLLGRRVHLFLFVKVREKWREEPARYRYLGLEFGD